MSETSQNIRTLIVCFVIALGVMIPLRFVEAGQEVETWELSQSQVLGESTETREVTVTPTSGSGLEAPYNDLDKFQF